MAITQRIRDGCSFTPTEEQLAHTILQLGERVQALSIKELARISSTSIASIHRFCKKLQLEGYKELKVELAREQAHPDEAAVDINFPFHAGDSTRKTADSIRSVYASTLDDTARLLDTAELDRAADLIFQAECVDMYTLSHNIHPARMFSSRLISIGKPATCEESAESQIKGALLSNERHVAVAISYSGLNPEFPHILPVLAERNTPIILIGTRAAHRLHPGLAVYLTVSNSEHLQDRITQFASHIAVQYVLDTLFSCVFERDYDRHMDWLRASLPYTRLPIVPAS